MDAVSSAVAPGVSRFFTSDLHFAHTNVITYCNRPFSSVEQMNEWLVSAWNATVGPADEVWVLGDAILGRVDENLRVVSRLNGVVHLVVGNHDKPFRRDRVTARPAWEEAYLAAGFSSIVHGETVLRLLDGTDVVVSHFPYCGDSREESRYLEHRPQDRGMWQLHGHVHGAWRQSGRMINVGVDAWAGMPVSERALCDLIAAGPAERVPFEWQRR